MSKNNEGTLIFLLRHRAQESTVLKHSAGIADISSHTTRGLVVVEEEKGAGKQIEKSRSSHLQNITNRRRRST